MFGVAETINGREGSFTWAAKVSWHCEDVRMKKSCAATYEKTKFASIVYAEEEL